MALINDSRLFTGGNERLDSRPHVQLYAQLKQKEQARNEAFDEYVRNLNKNINPAGLRNQERPVFEDKLRQWQEFGMQNREALRNPRKDGGRASMEFQNRYQELNNLVAESKLEEEKKKPLIEVMTDPNKRDRLNEDELFPKIQSHDKGIFTKDPQTGEWVRDAERRSFSVADLNYNPALFDQEKFFRGLDDVKPSNTNTTRTPNKDATITETSISEFTPQDKEVIAYRAVGQYGQDKSFQKLIRDLPIEEVKDLALTYKKAFGEDPTEDAQIAVAYALKGKQQSSRTQKVEEDKFEQAKQLEAIKNANRRGLLALRQSMGNADKAANDLWIDEYVDRTVEDSAKPENRQEYKYKDGRTISGYKVPLDPVMRKAIGLDADKNNGVLIATDDGKFIIAPYKTDDKYQPIKGDDGKYAIDPEKSASITQDQLKLALGKTSAGVKQTNVEMNVPSPKSKATYHIKGKNYSEGDLIKMGYTIDQIRPYKK